MAVIKNKLKAGESLKGKLVSVDADENKITMTDKDGKEFVQPVNSITADYIDTYFDSGEVLHLGFDGEDYEVEPSEF